MEDRIIDLLEGYEPTIQEDFEPVDFSVPVDCGAKAICLEAGRETGVGASSGTKFDIFKIKMQVSEVLSIKDESKRTAAKNRIVEVTYFIEPNNFQKPNEVVMQILNDLKTAGYPLKVPKEKIEDEDLYQYIATHFIGLKDKVFDIRCYPGKKKPNGTRNQKVRIVNRDVTAKKKDKSNVPF